MGEVGGALLLHGCAGDDLETEEAALPDGADAVSYTHLDVYKRQLPL